MQAKELDEICFNLSDKLKAELTSSENLKSASDFFYFDKFQNENLMKTNNLNSIMLLEGPRMFNGG